MRHVFSILLLLIALSAVALAAPKQATPPPKDDRPKGTVGSGAITMGQIQSGLQYLIAKKYGINVNYVLPTGWEVIEQVRPGKGKTPGVFASISRKKMADPDEPTDFIFELDIYEPNILADLPDDLQKTDKKKFDEEVGKRFKGFLDAQLSVNIKGQNKVVSRPTDIVPKPYGPDKGRPKTIMVPIHYDVAPPKGSKGDGAQLSTFTGLTSGHVWQLKFLVNKDQLPTYQPLIAMIVNNAFALTDSQQADLEKNTKAVQQKARDAAKAAKGKNTKSKGKN